MTEVLLEVEGLSFSFGAAPALAGVSLRVNPGEHIAIVGHNGAGKTTLLRCLARVYAPSRGSVRLLGKELSSYSAAQLARLVTYVPQHFHPAFSFTVLEFVGMSRYPHLQRFSPQRGASPDKVGAALEATHTTDLAERPLPQLSGGERQRVLIAAAIAQEASLMLLDEPLNGVDPRHQDLMLALFERVKQTHGVAMISATHDINTAACMADRILALKHGGAVYCGDAAGFMKSDTLRAVFDKDFCLVKHPRREAAMILPG